MKRDIIFIIIPTILIIVAMIGALIMIPMSNPLRKSEGNIRKRLLEITPVDSTMDEVVEAAKKNGWEVRGINNKSGYGLTNNGRPTAGGNNKVGVQSIKLDIGKYYNPFRVDISVFYGFDEDGKLIDLAVIKYIDVI